MTASQTIALEAEELSLHYDRDTHAFDAVNLTINRGKCVALVGPSGGGKTSLLRCLAGRIKQTTGSYASYGNIASIHQDLKLVRSRTARENVLHGSIGRYPFLKTLFGFPSKEVERADALLKRVGLSHRADHIVSQLSGGEQQRVAIARALMQDPEILLADEPVSALDDEAAHSTMKLIRSLTDREKLTVLIVLHDLSLAEHYADRIITLEKGEITGDRLVDRSKIQTIDSSLNQIEEEITHPQRSKSPIFGAALLISLVAISLYFLDVSTRDVQGILPRLGQFLLNMLPASFSEIKDLPWNTLTLALLETVQMAFLGTIFGAVIAIPFSVLAAENTGIPLLREPVRFFLNILRTVPSLLWALLFVAAVGLGPLAGVLALSTYSIGYLSKFFYEGLEAIDRGPSEALEEIGASGPQRFIHAIWPAARATLCTNTLFMMEYNVRAASILGIVDAGGIGFYIKEYVDFRYFPAVTACLVLLLIVVLALDMVSRRMRSYFVKQN